MPMSLCEETDLIGWLSMEYELRGEKERKNLIAAHLEMFRDSFQVKHHAASELRFCCIIAVCHLQRGVWYKTRGK